jgi:hypothetical protein
LIDRNLNGKPYSYLEATIPGYWPDYEEIESLEDVVK